MALLRGWRYGCSCWRRTWTGRMRTASHPRYVAQLHCRIACARGGAGDAGRQRCRLLVPILLCLREQHSLLPCVLLSAGASGGACGRHPAGPGSHAGDVCTGGGQQLWAADAAGVRQGIPDGPLVSWPMRWSNSCRQPQHMMFNLPQPSAVQCQGRRLSNRRTFWALPPQHWQHVRRAARSLRACICMTQLSAGWALQHLNLISASATLLHFSFWAALAADTPMAMSRMTLLTSALCIFRHLLTVDFGNWTQHCMHTAVCWASKCEVDLHPAFQSHSEACLRLDRPATRPSLPQGGSCE